jgi:hypothetical protein
MKKFILFIFSLFFFLEFLNAQELIIICDPGYRVYIDGEFKGFTSEEQDGIYIPKISKGEYLLEFKKGAEFYSSYDLYVEHEDYNEVVIDLLKGNYSFRKDGYYIALLQIKSKKTLFGPGLSWKNYLLFYMGDDLEYTEEVEVKWAAINIYSNNQRNNYSPDDAYLGLFKLHPIGDFNQKMHLVWGGTLSIDKEGNLEGYFSMSLEGYNYLLDCNGSFNDEGPNFKLRMIPDQYDPVFDKDLIFEFKQMSE